MSADLTPKDASDKPSEAVRDYIPVSLSISDGRVKMSFSPKTIEGAKKLIQATLHECKKLEDMRDKELLITDYLSHPAQTAGDTEGEVKEFTRIVVFDNNGEAYSCGSLGVDKALALLELTRGKAPWNPPAKVTVRIRRLANKNNWMILEPDLDSLVASIGGKH